MATTKEKLRIGNRVLEISNRDKVFYPKTGFTKGDVIDYYRAVGPVLVPHLKDRALTLKRYPDGVEGQFFYEKRCPPYRPEWMATVSAVRQRDGKEIQFCVVNNLASLIWTVNLGNLELHTSLARARDLSRPTAVVFDLDPDPKLGVLACADVGLDIREMLADLGLESFIKTSGSKGMQMYAPLNAKASFGDTGRFAHEIALRMESKFPERIVSNMKKELRVGKVFIDWSQNAIHKTTATVYSLRARETPAVSTPVTWKEVARAVKRDDPELLRFEASEVLERVARRGDLFEPVLKLKQRLPRL